MFSTVNGRDDLNTIAGRLGIAESSLERCFSILSKTEIIRYDDALTTPLKPQKPQSLAFWIHTTNACNLGCSYCYISTLNTGKAMPDHVQQQLITKLVETTTRQDITNIRLRLAGGEPLSQFHSWKVFIPQAKAALANVGCNLEISFLTTCQPNCAKQDCAILHNHP